MRKESRVLIYINDKEYSYICYHPIALGASCN